MTTEQKEMLANVPERKAPRKKLVTKKRAAITLGLVVGGTAAYYFGPRIIGKVQARAVKNAVKIV